MSSIGKGDKSSEELPVIVHEVDWIPVDRLEANPFNPNVMDHSTFQALKVDVMERNYDPLIVSPKHVFYGDMTLPRDRYVIVDGEKRWLAACELDQLKVKCQVQDIAESEARALCYKRSRERGRLDPIKEGELFDLEIKEGLTEEQVAEKYTVSRSYVASKRSLLKVYPSVEKMYREPEEGLKEAQTRGMDEEEIENLELPVPRGTITPSHLEALASLPQKDQVEIAKDVLERDLTVRETEKVVRGRRKLLDRMAHFKEALARAVQKTCPWCGSEPKDFDTAWDHEAGEAGEWGYDESKFDCSSCWHDWDYMKEYPGAPEKAIEAEERKKKEVELRSERLREAQANPSYVRILEDPDELDLMVRPWLLTKINQLTDVKKLEIIGMKDGKKFYISYTPPVSEHYRMNLNMRMEDPETGATLKRFGFDVEKKLYKKFPERSKVNLRETPSEESRDRLRRFFNEIIRTDRDPWEESFIIELEVKEEAEE